MTSELEGQPDKAYVDALRTKWGFKDDSRRSSVAALILESQARHFKRLTEEVENKSKLDETFIHNLFGAMKSQLRKHPLLNICSIQPMTGPIGIIHWYQQQYSENEGLPTVRLDIARTEIRAESRRVKARFIKSDDLQEMWNSPVSVNGVVEELLTEVAREVLGTMLNLCDNKDTPRIDYAPEDENDLSIQLMRTAHHIHRETQRAPANRVIGNEQMLTELGVDVPISNGQVQDLGVWNERFRVFFDPLFPAGKLMAWYQSDRSEYDTGMIYSPYVMVELTPTYIDPPDDMCVDATMRMRHKMTVVRPEFFRVIQR